MAVTKTITANGSKNHHKFALTVTEDSTNTSTNKSYISFSFTLSLINPGSNWNWYGFGSDVTYKITINGVDYTGSIGSYDASGTVTVRSGNNIEVLHDSDGTKTIGMSFEVKDTSGSPYPPGNASNSSTLQLTDLHKPADLDSLVFTEQNATLSSLGVQGNYFVPFLSIKQATITATPYDEATITKYQLINGGLTYESSTNIISMNLQNNPLYTRVYDNKNIADLYVKIYDNKGGISQTTYTDTNIIPYTKPSIEKTSSTIRRKSGNGVNLTDNKASLNLKATFYKGNDAVGNNNTLTQIGYKIWASDDTEPVNYTTLIPTITGGEITVTDLEISNIIFTKVYYYKFIVTDNYGYTTTIDDGRIPIGQPLWSEYPDRVDFLKITVNQSDPFEYSQNETIVGVFEDNGSLKPIYRQVIDVGLLPNNNSMFVNHNISNIDKIVRLYGSAIKSSNKETLPLPYATVNSSNIGVIMLYADDTTISINANSDRSAYNGYIFMEYTKTTD